MNKKIVLKYILFFAISMFLNALGVFADAHDDTEKAVSEGNAYLLCNYENIGTNGNIVKIYYYPASSSHSTPYWRVHYRTMGTYATLGDTSSQTTFNSLFNSKIHYDSYNKHISNENDFKCTQYAYLDTDKANELCLTNDKDSCGGHFKNEATYGLKNDNRSLFYRVDTEAKKILQDPEHYWLEENSDSFADYSEIINRVEENTINYVKVNYFGSGHNNLVYPTFVDKYIKEGVANYGNEVTIGAKKAKEYIDNKCNTGAWDQTKCENERNKVDKISGALTNHYKGIAVPQGSGNNFEHYEDDFSGNCKDFAPTIRLGGILLILVEIFVPIIIIVKSSFSMFNVVTKGNAEELKKQFSKLVTALVAAILIFLTPKLVDIAFSIGIANSNSRETSDALVCKACIFHPFSGECEQYGIQQN